MNKYIKKKNSHTRFPCISLNFTIYTESLKLQSICYFMLVKRKHWNFYVTPKIPLKINMFVHTKVALQSL